MRQVTRTPQAYRLAAALAAVLVVGCVGSAFLSGCSAAALATPEEQQALDAYDGQIEDAEESVDALEDEALGKLDQIRKLAQELPGADPARADEIRLEMLSLLAEVDDIRIAWEQEIAALEDVLGRAADLEHQIGERNAGAISGVLGSINPQLGLWAALLGPLAVRFGFERSRKHLAEAAKRFVKLGVGDSVQYLAKAYGLQHTEEEWHALLDRSIEAARRAGDDDRVLQLKALRDQIAQQEKK